MNTTKPEFPELKDCPFCGSVAGLPEIDDGYAHVECYECGAEGPSKSSFKEASDAWNVRYTESAYA